MNRTLLRNPVTIGILALVALILIGSTFSIVPETQQVVVLRFEQPVGDAINRWQPNQAFGNTGAGLIARIPFIDRLVWIDKRVLDVELDNQRVLSTEQQPLEVDAYARFRIVDPLRAVTSTGSASDTEDRVSAQLQTLFNAALQDELGKRPFAALLTPERGQVMANIRIALQQTAANYGVQVVDVRIKHADLPSGAPLDSALDRMRTARLQRSQSIIADGARQAQIIRADADAQAAQIYALSYNQDPDFYDFYRAMLSYRYTMGGANPQDRGRTNLILSPNSAYLRQLEGGGRTAPAPAR